MSYEGDFHEHLVGVAHVPERTVPVAQEAASTAEIMEAKDARIRDLEEPVRSLQEALETATDDGAGLAERSQNRYALAKLARLGF